MGVFEELPSPSSFVMKVVTSSLISFGGSGTFETDGGVRFSLLDSFVAATIAHR